MDAFYKALFYLHICAGFTSLSVFFVPMIARKGGKAHVRMGWVYVYGMSVVLLTAFLLSGLMAIRGQWAYATFFGFLTLITARPLYFGTVIVRYRGRNVPPRVRTLSLWAIGAAAVLAPLLLLAGSGLVTGRFDGLLIVFGLLGLTTWPEWLNIRRTPVLSSQRWLYDHLRGMLTSSIAAFTAFFAFGGSRLLGDLFRGNVQILLWMLPTLLGFLAIRHYKKKYLPPAVQG